MKIWDQLLSLFIQDRHYLAGIPCSRAAFDAIKNRGNSLCSVWYFLVIWFLKTLQARPSFSCDCISNLTKASSIEMVLYHLRVNPGHPLRTTFILETSHHMNNGSYADEYAQGTGVALTFHLWMPRGQALQYPQTPPLPEMTFFWWYINSVILVYDWSGTATMPTIWLKFVQNG
jgi:hypothetical protein